MNFLNRSLRKIGIGNKIVIYTALLGGCDELLDPLQEIKGCDFVCFTDDPKLKSDVYEIILCKAKFDDPNRSAKIYKLLPHKFLPKYEFSLWVDGNVIIKLSNIELFIQKFLGKNNFAALSHPERDCIYDEYKVCLEQKRGEVDLMKKQIQDYRKEGYPSNNGLIAGTILLRKHMASEVRNFDEGWWKEVQKYSRRDQLSFPYVAWKMGLKYSIIDGVLWDNDYVKLVGHKKIYL